MSLIDRPLVCLDLEATGVDTESARIIEIALQRFVPGQSRPVSTFEQVVDPGVEVPQKVQELTGISQEDVIGQPTFAEVAEEVTNLIADADLLGYNAGRYDVPLLEAEYERLGQKLPGPVDRTIVDPYKIFVWQEPRTLEGAVRFYLGREHKTDAHRAAADVRATAQVFQAQLKRYDNMGSTLREISENALAPYLDHGRKLKRTDEGIVFCFGGHKDKTLAQVLDEDPGYVDWMKKNFSAEVVAILEAYTAGREAA
jgi:DNA polymerase-3 subunit epsilon